MAPRTVEEKPRSFPEAEMGETRAVPEPPRLTPRAGLTARELEAAVARGIITAGQRDQLLALDFDDSGARPADGEARAGLNLVTIGYWAGSMAVLFALAWFLADRWKSLRPGGVLIVALLYATSFALSSAFVGRLGFRFAAALLAVLTVGMAPIVTWALESLLGVWPTPAFRRDLFVGDVIESVRWIPIQLSMALAGLIALRRVRFGILALTVAIPAGVALVQLTPWFFDPDLSFRLSAWMTIVAGTLMLLAAFVTDRRSMADGEDYTGWLYLAALGFVFVGIVGVMDQSRLMRHLLPAIVAALVATGFTLRRRLFLLPAGLLFIVYLTFLARDVFPTAVGFMVVMLSVGALLILGTVLLQRRFPHVIRRFTGEGTARRAPGWLGAAYGACVLLSVALLFVSIPVARRDLVKLQQRRDAMFRQQVERQRASATVTRRQRPQGAETPRETPP